LAAPGYENDAGQACGKKLMGDDYTVLEIFEEGRAPATHFAGGKNVAIKPVGLWSITPILISHKPDRIQIFAGMSTIEVTLGM